MGYNYDFIVYEAYFYSWKWNRFEAEKEHEKYFNRIYKNPADTPPDRAKLISKLLLSVSILIRYSDLSQWRHQE